MSKDKIIKSLFCKISFPILSLSHHLPNNPQLSVTAKISAANTYRLGCIYILEMWES